MQQEFISGKLGPLTNRQFQLALDYFNLGSFVQAKEIFEGVSGQNIFLTSIQGEFVFKGSPKSNLPHSSKLFAEQFFSERLGKFVPTPNPFLVCTDESIFGFKFAIIPKLKGLNISNDLNDNFLSSEDMAGIAVAQGKFLNKMQICSWNFCGIYSPETRNIKPYNKDWLKEFSDQILFFLEKASKHNLLTTNSDFKWVKQTIANSKSSFTEFKPTFFMQDFKPANMLVDKVNSTWEVRGLFDLVEGSVGHPEADLCRLFALYIRHGKQDLAYTFLNSYLLEKLENKMKNESEKELEILQFVQRFKIFMLHDRCLLWEWHQRSNTQWWDKKLSFKEWATQFMFLDPVKLMGK